MRYANSAARTFLRPAEPARSHWLISRLLLELSNRNFFYLKEDVSLLDICQNRVFAENSFEMRRETRVSPISACESLSRRELSR